MKPCQFILSLLLLQHIFFCNQLKAQCTGEIITLNNASFEDSPSKGLAPSGWIACQSGQSPDIQPGNFGITLSPFNGLSYAGLYFIDTTIYPNIGTWQEGLSQQLPSSLKTGMEYQSSIKLSNSSSTDSGLEPGCAELEIWGGFSACDHTELLWSSGNIANYDSWQSYPVHFIPAQDYTYISLQIKGLGCSGMPYILMDDLATLIPSYKINVNITSNSDSVCAGSLVVLSAQADNGIGSYTYVWNADTLNNSSINISPETTKTYSVIVSDSAGCASAPEQITVFVFSPLSLSYSVDSVCEGEIATLELSGKGGDGNYQYFLSPLNMAGSTHKFIPNPDQTYTVSLSDGCQTIIDTLPITVYPKPSVNISYNIITNALYSYGFNSQISLPSGLITSTTWNFGDQTGSFLPNPVHTYSNPGLYQVELEVISDKGCKAKVKSDLNSGNGNEIGVISSYNTSPEDFPQEKLEAIAEKDELMSLRVYTMTGSEAGSIKIINNNIAASIYSMPLPAGTYIYKAVSRGNNAISGKISIVR